MEPALKSLHHQLVECTHAGTASLGTIQTIGGEILTHPELTGIVADRAKRNPRRVIVNIPAWTLDHVPGVLRKVRVKKNNGDTRITWSPTDHDYVIGLRINYGLAVPLGRACAHMDTHGFIPGRGTQSAIESIMDITSFYRGEVTVTQEDIRDCFPTIRVAGLIDKIAPGILADYVELLHHRYVAADRTATHMGSGLPQGHPVSPAVMALTIDHLIQPTRILWHGRARLIVYCDDITILTRTAAEGVQIRDEMAQALEAFGIKFNPDKARTTNVQAGEPFECLGYKLQWDRAAGRLMVGPKDAAYPRLTEKLANALDAQSAKRIEKGWINAYRLSNTPDHRARTQEAIRSARYYTATTTTHR